MKTEAGTRLRGVLGVRAAAYCVTQRGQGSSHCAARQQAGMQAGHGQHVPCSCAPGKLLPRNQLGEVRGV